MTSQGLTEPLSLRHTNVSNPSIIHARPSQQSIAASEDYYSLSGSTTSDEPTQRLRQPPSRAELFRGPAQDSNLALVRTETPPEKYRTPFQSSSHLPRPSQSSLAGAATSQNVIDVASNDEDARKTPMHGEGKRRSSHSYASDAESAAAGAAAGGMVASALRVGGIRRKPVPSTIGESPTSEMIDPTRARSSVFMDMRHHGVISPEVDDGPHVRVALEQVSADEDVRNMDRLYDDGTTYEQELDRRMGFPASTVKVVNPRDDGRSRQAEPVPVDESPLIGGRAQHAEDAPVEAAAAGLVGGAALEHAAHDHHGQDDARLQRPSPQRPPPARPYEQRPQPRPQPTLPRPDEGSNAFISVSNESRYHQSLNFIPTLLRPLWLILFILHVLLVLAILLLCAIWSLTHKGIFDYGYFGDSKYFIFEYLPTSLGMLLFFWLVQIQVAVYRIAPFVAMSSEAAGRGREEGSNLPLVPKTFLLPFFGHFRARQPVVGSFLLAAWLQIFTIPLLASAFNVRSIDKGAASTWRWIATAGAIWPAIALYIFLLVTTSLLLSWVLTQRRRVTGTGLKWDPRSLADLIVLLERSNALSLNEDDEIRLDAPMLGYWRTSRGGNEVFHSYGIADRSARTYTIENGRIREDVASCQELKSRFSDFEEGQGREQRHSREKMLPKLSHGMNAEAGLLTGGRAVPWFLRTPFAILWIIIAVLLLLGFLIASYLPATAVIGGFTPLVSSVVSGLGFSGENFLYSFVPATIAMICFLGMLDIDYAHRRLQPYTSLLAADGELAEKSLLLAYTADLPLLATGSALVNSHWRVAIFSLSSLLALALPVLGGGVFWAEFYVPTQRVRIWAQMAGFYALTVFVVLYALAIIIFIFPNGGVRHLNHSLPRGNKARSFRDVLDVVRMSRMLDDIAFHAVGSKIDLVTRLLSASPATASGHRNVHAAAAVGRLGNDQEVAGSKVSLADSLRGFGTARHQASVEVGHGQVPRYALGRFWGRDGRECVGIDRVRAS